MDPAPQPHWSAPDLCAADRPLSPLNGGGVRPGASGICWLAGSSEEAGDDQPQSEPHRKHLKLQKHTCGKEGRREKRQMVCVCDPAGRSARRWMSEPKYFLVGDRQNPVGTAYTEGIFNFLAKGRLGWVSPLSTRFQPTRRRTGTISHLPSPGSSALRGSWVSHRFPSRSAARRKCHQSIGAGCAAGRALGWLPRVDRPRM